MLCIVVSWPELINHLLRRADYHAQSLTSVVDPADCGCGFMSEARVRALSKQVVPRTEELGAFFRNRLVLFPSLTFTCFGEVLGWIVSGRQTGNTGITEIQLWRQLEQSPNVYEKISSATVSPQQAEEDRVYEFDLNSRVYVQPGDILGIFHPLLPAKADLRVEYEQDPKSVYYSYVSTRRWRWYQRY